MSGEEYTHSTTGKKLYDAKSVSDAMSILQPLIELAAQDDGTNGMYLLTEW